MVKKKARKGIVWSLMAAVVVSAAACGSPPTAPPPTVSVPLGVSGKAPAGALITLDPIPAREFPAPTGSAVMDQYAKQFVPDLVIARVGQEVEFLNSDDFGHNVIVNKRSTGASIFNVSLDSRQKHVFVFTQPGEYAVMCDIHEGMLATVVVTATPYSTRADPSGSFVVPGVPAGKYKASMVLPGGGSREQLLEIFGDKTELKFMP